MSVVFDTVGKALGGILKGVGLVSTPKAPPAPLPTATVDDAAQQQAADDDLRRRKGAAADIITGAQGSGTPLTGGKLVLGS